MQISLFSKNENENTLEYNAYIMLLWMWQCLTRKRFRPLSDVFTSVYKMRHTLETTENTNNSFCSHISIRRKQHKGVKKLFVLQTPVISKNSRFHSAHVKWSSVICHLFILAYIHTFIPIYCNIFEEKQPWWCYNLVLCYQIVHLEPTYILPSYWNLNLPIMYKKEKNNCQNYLENIISYICQKS